MPKQLNNVQRIQQYLKKIYRLLNEQIFDSQLDDVQVVLSNNSRVYGYYTTNNSTWTGKRSNGDELSYHEIGISSQYLATRDITEVVATLAHECVHHLLTLQNIKHCSRGGQYHSKKFAACAIEHGLVVEYDQRIGYAITSCGDRLLQFCIDNDLQDIIHLNIPVVYDNTEKPCLSLDKNICDESVVLFTR